MPENAASGKKKNAGGGEAHAITEGDDEPGWTMTVQLDASEVKHWGMGTDEKLVMPILQHREHGILMFDGGSDEHCCQTGFCENLPIASSRLKFKDAQRNAIPVDGECSTPMVIRGLVNAITKFQVGESVGRNLLITGKLHDAGFDVAYSHTVGCYVEKNDRTVDMIRRGNVFGLNAKTYKAIKEAKAALKLIGERAPATSVPDREMTMRLSCR